MGKWTVRSVPSTTRSDSFRTKVYSTFRWSFSILTNSGGSGIYSLIHFCTCTSFVLSVLYNKEPLMNCVTNES